MAQPLPDDAPSLRMLAEDGSADAQFKLGFMYATGKGVPQNYVAAYAWLSIAAAGGNSRAEQARDGLISAMTRTQIERGQKLASELFDRIESATPK